MLLVRVFGACRSQYYNYEENYVGTFAIILIYDNWREDMITKTTLYDNLSARNSESSRYYISKIDMAYKLSDVILKRIVEIFPNYTNHDISHSMNVISIMGDIIDDLDSLTDLELTVLIMSALTHDLGMFISDGEIQKVISDELKLGNRLYSKVLEHVSDKQVALEECVRPLHGKRSRTVLKDAILSVDGSIFNVYGSQHSYFDSLSKINQGHNESMEWIAQNLDPELNIGLDKFNPMYTCIILRISDLLDIDDRRTSFVLRDHLSLPEVSINEWDKHKVIMNYKKIKRGVNNEKIIYFDGKTNSPGIYRNLLSYFDYIKEEVKNTNEFCNNHFNDVKYQPSIYPIIENNIKTEGFRIAEYRLNLDYSAITELLMGEKIYGDRKYGMRELIQNALDACDVLAHYEGYDLDEFGKPEIKIWWDEDKNKLTVSDTGVGMSESVLKKYFLNVGLSYYKSVDFLYSGSKSSPIGNYGIGFLSCFMLSDKVTISTKHYEENITQKIELYKNSEFIDIVDSSENQKNGTKIILDLNQVKKVFENEYSLKYFIESNFLKHQYKITLWRKRDKESKEISLDLFDFKAFDNHEWKDISRYLNDVDVFVKLKKGNLTPIVTLKDFKSEPYIAKLDNRGIAGIFKADDIEVSKIIENNTLHLIQVPIINDHKMEDALFYLGDFESALGSVNHDIVNIFYKKEEFKFADNTFYDLEDPVLYFAENEDNYITLKDIYTSYGGEYTYSTDIEIMDIEFLFEEHKRRYLQYYTEKRAYNFGYIPQLWPIKQDSIPNESLFVKGVLVKNFNLEFSPIIKGLEVEDFIINVNSSTIVPTITRNSIPQTDAEELSYSINKNVLSDYIENEDNDNLRELAKSFSAKFYNSSNKFDKGS